MFISKEIQAKINIELTEREKLHITWSTLGELLRQQLDEIIQKRIKGDYDYYVDVQKNAIFASVTYDEDTDEWTHYFPVATVTDYPDMLALYITSQNLKEAL